MEIAKYKAQPRHFFSEDVSAKRRGICLHFTAGYPKGDLAELTRGKKSVPYLVNPDGSIIELHEPRFWAYHLGPGCSGGNKAMSQRFIGIEISNLGPLFREGDLLMTWANKKYCHINEKEKYIRESFRGADYYAVMPQAQIDAVCRLADFLCNTFDIPKVVLGNRNYNRDIKNFEGVATHSNFRFDKYDVGPAFSYQNLLTFGFQIV